MGRKREEEFPFSVKVLDNSFERHDHAPPLSFAPLFSPGKAVHEKLFSISPRCNIIFSRFDRSVVEEERETRPSMIVVVLRSFMIYDAARSCHID